MNKNFNQNSIHKDMWILIKPKYLPIHPEFLKLIAKSGLLQTPFCKKAMSKH